jgi:23S rRNA pseudouridine1911/1915/1917 synthase
MTHIGHPIVADKLYSGRDRLTLDNLTNPDHPTQTAESFTDPPLIERQALHAHRLQFRHPITERELDLTAQVPDDMSRTLEALRAHQGL